MELAIHPSTELSFFPRVWTLLKSMRRLNINPADRIAQRSFMLSLDRASLEEQLEYLRSTPDGRTLLARRPLLDSRHIPVARLLAFDPGTFGRALGEFYAAHKFDPFPAPEHEPINDLEWMAQRVSDTHDCLHALTGYDGQPIGEVEIHGFMWAQSRPYTSLIVLPFGFFMALRRFSPWAIWRRFKAGWARGLASRRADDLIWEDWLDRPLAELRAHVGLD
ncbi:MAG: Coq4 family protein [Archangium sp.]